MIDLVRHGARPAIENADGTVITYAELAAMARPTTRVVEVPAERTATFVATCLGALVGGGAFVPVDPCDPRRRPTLTATALTTTGLAYAIATSGSTGAPKLVMVGRAGIPALLRTQIDAFALGPGTRSLWLHAPMFDASISDWGTALASGATLVIPTTTALASPARLRAEIESRGITHVDLPPSLLGCLDPLPPSLRVVVLGGEACDVGRVRELATRVRVVVVYGPTEATVCSSLAVVDPDRWERPLIGHPLPGVTYRVIDGELYIGGEALALGYASDPVETARRFVDVDNQRMYRTGDRVEATAHGLAFVGRVDRQRKLRGRRVELDEIEVALRRAVDAGDAGDAGIAGDAGVAVVVRGERIVALVEGTIDRSKVVLPPFMMPARFVSMALPRTATGKIDRAALEATELPAPHITFTDPLEAELAMQWCQALGVDGVARDDRFSEAGGDSLARMMFDEGICDGDPTFGQLVERARQARRRVTVAELEALATLEYDRLIRPTDIARHGDAVLVTGASGFLGRELARRWPGAVIALAHQAPIDGVETIHGDLSRPDLGLEREAWLELASRIGAVVHCAATVRLGGSWDEHVGANVHGTIEALRIGHALPFHYISTLSVFASTDHARGRHEPTATPNRDAIVYGGYAQTKVAAEALVRRRTALTTIFRLGLLVGKSDRPTDQLPMTIRGLRKLGAVPDGFDDDRFDTTAIDVAADAIVRLAASATTSSTFHIASRGMAFGDVVDRLKLPRIALITWRERARARLDDPDIAMAHAAFSRKPELDLFRATGADFCSCVEMPPLELS